MNIFNKVTLQSMKKSRTRTIVTIIGVVLSAAMITAVTTFGVSLLNYMTNGAIQKYGNWHVEFLDVPSSFVQERTHDEEVADTAAFENIGYATLDGGKNPNKPYLFIAGFSKETFSTLPINLMSGRLPENSGEILVSGSVAVNGGVKFSEGDTLSLAVGSRMDGNKNLGQHIPYISGKETFVPEVERTYTVVGIYQRPGFEESSAPGYTLITKADVQDKVDNFSLFVKLKNPRQLHAYASSKAGSETYVFNDNVLRFMGLSDDNLFNTLLYAVGGIVVVIIMIGSIFLIYNAFTISLNERTRQFGILSSVGATARQLRNSVLFEGLCIGCDRYTDWRYRRYRQHLACDFRCRQEFWEHSLYQRPFYHDGVSLRNCRCGGGQHGYDSDFGLYSGAKGCKHSRYGKYSPDERGQS